MLHAARVWCRRQQLPGDVDPIRRAVPPAVAPSAVDHQVAIRIEGTPPDALPLDEVLDIVRADVGVPVDDTHVRVPGNRAPEASDGPHSHPLEAEHRTEP